MKGFNLSRWALEHIPLTRYLIAVLLIGGLLADKNLGQDEDPPFTFRAMVVQAFWPGATALQMLQVPAEEVEQLVQGVRDWDYRPVVDAVEERDAGPPAVR